MHHSYSAAPLVFGAGVLVFPVSYVFGDILTEVYGYARARKVIWAGFTGLGFASFMAAVVVALPPAPFWNNQPAYEIAFGSTWRIVLASMCAYFCGEFVNSYVLAKMKISTNGRWLWTRTIGSTLVGELVDSVAFVGIAILFGVFPVSLFWTLTLTNYLFKVALEVAFTPITYFIVGKLKKAEHEDYYDRDTIFNPFQIS